VIAVSFTVKPAVTASVPRLLVEDHYQASAPGYTSYDTHPDGQRFVTIKPVAPSSGQQIKLVLNWFEQLRQRVPVK